MTVPSHTSLQIEQTRSRNTWDATHARLQVSTIQQHSVVWDAIRVIMS